MHITNQAVGARHVREAFGPAESETFEAQEKPDDTTATLGVLNMVAMCVCIDMGVLAAWWLSPSLFRID